MKHSFYKTASVFAAAAALTAGGLLYYGNQIEPRQLHVVRPVLQKAPPVRVVFLADIHLGKMYSPHHLRRIVDTVNSLHPAMILFGGDFFAKFPKDYAMLNAPARSAELARLHAPLGKFAVLGNHDIRKGGRPYAEELLGNGGFQVLWNENLCLSCGISLCGLSPYSDGFALRELPQKGYRICLCHMPDRARYLSLQQCDLVLSGHSHGGQVRLPVLSRIIYPPGGKLYPHGLYYPQGTERAALFTSVGIGLSGLPFRFRCPPEIVVLEPKNSSS